MTRIIIQRTKVFGKPRFLLNERIVFAAVLEVLLPEFHALLEPTTMQLISLIHQRAKYVYNISFRIGHRHQLVTIRVKKTLHIIGNTAVIAKRGLIFRVLDGFARQLTFLPSVYFRIQPLYTFGTNNYCTILFNESIRCHTTLCY